MTWLYLAYAAATSTERGSTCPARVEEFPGGGR